MNAVIAVEPVVFLPLQIYVIDACAAVEHVVVDHHPFEVQDAHQFAFLDGNAVNRKLAAGFPRFGFVQGDIALRMSFADQAALGAVPVDEQRGFKSGTGVLGRVDRVEDFPASLVVFQVERRDENAPLRRCDTFKQGFSERGRAGKRLDA